MQDGLPSLSGTWNLWKTEVPTADPLHLEKLTLSPTGDATWQVAGGASETSVDSLRWSMDDGGHLLFTAKDGRVISQCEAELTGDLLVLTPEHGFRSVYERTAWGV